MKKLAVGVFILMTLVYASRSQTNWSNTVSANLFDIHKGSPIDVEFTVLAPTNVMVIGSTNTVRCRLINGSTNTISYDSGGRASDMLNVCFSNSTGSSYTVVESPKYIPNGYEPNVPAIVFVPLKSSEIKEWNFPIVIGSNNPPGKYQLTASQFIVQSGTRNAWKLQSDTTVTLENQSK